MPALPYLSEHVLQGLRGFAKEVCDRMQTSFRQEGHETSNWRFDAQAAPVASRDPSPAVQPIIEFLYYQDVDRRRVLFQGPVFRFAPGTSMPAAAQAMPAAKVRQWLLDVYECREAMGRAMRSGLILDRWGILPWDAVGWVSDVVCVLDGIPVPKVVDFPLEDVLPRRCFVHLVDGGDGAATAGAQECAQTCMRRGRIVAWIGADAPPVRESRYLASTEARSVEDAQQKILLVLGAKNSEGEPTPPSLLVLVHPDYLPTEHEAQFPDPQVELRTGVMWANFLGNLLLHETTVLVVSSVPDVDGYPKGLSPLVEPWQAIAKFERVYRSNA